MLMEQKVPKIWIADDDEAIRMVLEEGLKSAGLEIVTFADGESLIDALNTDKPDLIISDIKMPGMHGYDLLKHIKNNYDKLPVIIMTAFTDMQAAIDSYGGGAFEYIPKPFDLEEAIITVKKALEEHKETKPKKVSKSEIIGSAPSMQIVFRSIGKLANTNATVLIQGESGTGKELVSKSLHKNSPRHDMPFIALNMADIPKELIESELFGHEKGAFTGAVEQRIGRFEQANGGTLFLDEIGDMPLETQTRLLRVLSNKEFFRVGGDKPIKVDVRILAATHQSLESLVASGAFREDLYYRLNTISISLPPLRERGDDILLLFKKFATDFAENYKTDPIELNSEAIEVLNNYHWPGNIRQLKNFVAQLSIIEKNREIDADSLKYHLPKNTPNIPTIYKDKSKEDLSEREILYKVLFDMKNDLTELKKITYNLIIDSPKNNLSNSELEIFKELDQKQENEIAVDKTIEIHESLSLIEHERKLIVKALNKHKDRRKDAAKELGISERTLYRKLKEFEI